MGLSMSDAIKISSPVSCLFHGARVRMSRLGRERHPKYGDREGLIVGRGSPSSWRVKFDDRKTVQAIYRDYLELAAQPAGASPQVVPQVVPQVAPQVAPQGGPQGATPCS
jgi:hypothetical protein